jgi:hypothetical protein
MNRIGIRLFAAILASGATFGTLACIALLAELESPGRLPLVVMPEVVITASRSALAADARRDLDASAQTSGSRL